MHSPKSQALAEFNMNRSALLNAYRDGSILDITLEAATHTLIDFMRTPHVSMHGIYDLFEINDYRDEFLALPPLIGTYVIQNSHTGRVYVGSTKDFYKRWRKHQWLLSIGKHTNMRLQEEYDTWGVSGFTIELRNTFASTMNLLHYEMLETQVYDDEHLMNFKSGHRAVGEWNTMMNEGRGRQRFPAKFKRGPQSTKRWFDYN